MKSKGEQIKTIARVGVIIAGYYVIYAIYVGILNPIPALGDSWDYHIPIAKTILNGTFLHPINFRLPQWYYPGSSEVFLSLFILFHIPLTLSNLFATLILFFSLWKLGNIFRLSYYYSLLFALTFCTLNGVVRWVNAVSIDVWVAVFFVLSLILLEQPKKSLLYFFKLGCVVGMLVGSKYTALLFVCVLVGLYLRNILKILTLSRFLVFLLPFSFFGVFWYVRNYISTHNPFYPLDVVGFKGTNLFIENIGEIAFLYPQTMLDAGFGEYKIWIFTLFIALGWLLYRYIFQKNFTQDGISKLFLLGFFNFLLFLTFPTSEQPWIMVSSFRYSFPVFIPLLLGTFLLAKKYKMEEWIGYIAISSMIMVTSLEYYPKLVLFYLPFAFVVFYLIQKYEK
jgi:hypothetical protein